MPLSFGNPIELRKTDRRRSIIMSNIIEVNQLVKSYPGNDRPAVYDVSFAVRRGEIFGLLGSAGAGKTTICDLLSCRLKPDSGMGVIAGFDLINQSTDIKRRSKFVSQKPALYPLLSLQDNLLLYGRLHGFSGGQLKQRVAEALQVTSLDTCRRKRADKLPSSIQRRINLAAALLHQPEILLLDEPTLNIEAESRDTILKIVVEINRRGLTVVYATRDGEAATRLCHRVALIDQGRIVALDTPHALLDLLRGGCAAQENLDAVFLELTGKHLCG